MVSHPENQENPRFSFEIYRPDWAKPENDKHDGTITITSVFGFAEIDTKSLPAKVTLMFYELDREQFKMVETYKISISE